VKLFFDEDSGKGVAVALRAVGLPADYVGNRRRFRTGTEDEIWLPVAGREGWLVFSCNKAIITSDAQRAIFMRAKVGAIFLSTGHEKKLEILKFILRKWDWLERIDRDEPRPFAIEMPISGRNPRRLTLTLPGESGEQGFLL
jgi:hypothetical protein